MLRQLINSFVLLIILIAAASSSPHAQTLGSPFDFGADDSSLAGIGYSLSAQGRYSEAEPYLRGSLAIRERKSGPEHPAVAESLAYLGGALIMQGRFSDAEPFFRRALAIREKAFGPDSPLAAESLAGLGVAINRQNRSVEAEPYLRRAIAIQEKAVGLESPPVAESLVYLGSALIMQGRFSDAEPLFRRSLAIREKAFGPDSPAAAESLTGLGVAINRQNRSPEAESYLRRAIGIQEKALGLESPPVAESLVYLGGGLIMQGRFSDAEPLFRRSLAIREKAFGPDSPAAAESLAVLGAAISKQSRSVEAESYLRRAVSIQEKAFGNDSPQVAESLVYLGTAVMGQGRFSNAEPFFRRSLVIRERVFGSDSPAVAESLVGLGLALNGQNRTNESEPYLRRSIEIVTKALGPDNPMVAESDLYLGSALDAQGKFAEAEPLFQESIAIREKTFGADSFLTAQSLLAFGQFLLGQNRFADAEQYLRRSIEINEKAYGLESPIVADSVEWFARSIYSEGRFDEAQSLYRRALALREKGLANDSPAVGESLRDLGTLLSGQHQYSEAESLLRRAAQIYENAFGANSLQLGQVLSLLGTTLAEEQKYSEAETSLKRATEIDESVLATNDRRRSRTLGYLAKLYYRQHQYDKSGPLYEQALRILLEAHGIQNVDLQSDLAPSLTNIDDVEVITAVTDLAGNRYRSDRALAALTLIRCASELEISRLRKADRLLALSNSDERRNYTEIFRLHLSILAAAQAAQSDQSSESISKEAFYIAQFVNSNSPASSVSSFTARLAAGSDELSKIARRREDLLARWRSQDAARLKAAVQPGQSSISFEQFQREIDNLDSQLDQLDSRLRKEFPRFAELVIPEAVSVSTVQSWLGADEALVLWVLGSDESFVLVVRKDRSAFRVASITRDQVSQSVRTLRESLDPPNGHLFVELPPLDLELAYRLYSQLLGPADSLISDARSLILIADGALQSLPPAVLVSSPPKGPVTSLADYKSADWLVRRHALTTSLAASSFVALRQFYNAQRAAKPFVGFGDPDFRTHAGTESFSQLPETADELRAEALEVQADVGSSVHLGSAATVSKVTGTDLSDVKIVSFATHGILGNGGLSEPALALSPENDDGLLRASDISRLRLNADFVVLSACNTAVPDEAHVSLGVSSLATSFIYAGARSILVSQWEVNSRAAAQITTVTFRFLSSNPGIGRATALQQAMLSMIDSASATSADMHPYFWAPFVLMGEGGAGR
ncbi:CHAT domain-containing protein/Tfp pilus assembly protein PilF [Bradyrhizobium sp. USDA 3240]